MVSTVKFSNFATRNPNNPTNSTVGLGSGVNVIGQLTPIWTTSTRPATPYDGLEGYNSTIGQWEFWSNMAGQWLQFADNGTGFINWATVTASSIPASPNSGFVTNRSSTPVQITLPATFLIGQEVLVMGLGSGGWSLVCNTGQNIIFGSLSTSVDGAINSDIQNSIIFVRGLVANTTWSVTNCNSNPTLI